MPVSSRLMTVLDHNIMSVLFFPIIINRYRRGLETCPQVKRPKVDTLFSSLFFRRVRATSMTKRRVENTRVHFWTFSPVSVNRKISTKSPITIR